MRTTVSIRRDNLEWLKSIDKSANRALDVLREEYRLDEKLTNIEKRISLIEHKIIENLKGAVETANE
jgi:hypothetical protein